MKNRNELFVVLGTSAILALMIFSVLGMGAGCSDNSAQCTANLYKFYQASSIYAQGYDDWYPTVKTYQEKIVTAKRAFGEGTYQYLRPLDGGKWLGSESYKAFTILFDVECLSNPNDVICPNSKIKAAQPGQSLSGHVSYQWCDGCYDDENLIFSADGADNHRNAGNYVRIDGSVGTAKGSGSTKWFQSDVVKNLCKSPNELPRYSF